MLPSMPQEARSSTPSTQWSTYKLDTPVQFVKGVGPRLSTIFAKHNIKTVKDLLTFFPRTYEDRSEFVKIAQLRVGQKATLRLKILYTKKIPIRSRPKPLFEAICSDGYQTISLKFFNPYHGIETQFTKNREITVSGVAKINYSHFDHFDHFEMLHPEIIWDQATNINVGRIIPIYIEIENLSNRLLRKILWEAIQKFSSAFTEDLPIEILKKHSLPQLSQAIQMIHFPPQGASIKALSEFKTSAQERIIYEEFFKFEYLVLKQRLNIKKEKAISFCHANGIQTLNAFTNLLPFTLTREQKTAINEIIFDMAKPIPMNRLIQGDVGSGKTVVAFLTASIVLAEGGQVALMAPTEILAEQHFLNAQKLFNGKLNTAFLSGKTPLSERKTLQRRLLSGESMLLIGTHALIQEQIVFKNLNYALIDEQHRFGVEQRRILRNKGIQPGEQSIHPHILILTATPIPRTLALTAYGDLAVTTIKELPPGRSPVITQVIQEKYKNPAYHKIYSELKKGRQVYFIFPLIQESDAEGFTHLKAATTAAETLQKQVFPEFKVGLLHGQLKADEKAIIMEKFKKNEIQVLVSTTVIEVGIDVPNATVMAIEHSERFGLSQLHQLRGRVGRGEYQSYCFLFTLLSTNKNAVDSTISLKRLKVLENNNDGFKIAEEDLEIRGPGEFLGTRQSGALPFRMANLVRDTSILFRSRDDVIDILKKDPELNQLEHLALKKFFTREGNDQFEWLKTS